MKFIFYFSFTILLLLNSCDNLVDENTSYDYSIEQKRDCFCPQAGVWVKLYITADTVSNAFRISDNKQLTYNEFKSYKSIKDLFDTISKTDTNTNKLIVSFDPGNNYPSFLSIDLKPKVVNDSIIIVIADVKFSYTTKNYIKLK